jgi:hypothetical protein
MSNKVLHIKNPTKSLLAFVRKLGADKDAKKHALFASKSKYFKAK